MFLDDRYVLQDPLVHTSTGMAIVYRGRDMQTDHDVAIKVLRDIYSLDPTFVMYFQAKAGLVLDIQHRNIVQIYDRGQADGRYYIVMELVKGVNLRRYLRARQVLPVDQAVFIAHAIALGLGAAHKQHIVHQAVEPKHVLIAQSGAVKLISFGKSLGSQYFAPEQIQGEMGTPATDVYALAILLYEMLTGYAVFDGETPVDLAMQHIHDTPIPPSRFNAEIPPALEEIILRCLEKVPERRYRDGTEVAHILETLAGSPPFLIEKGER